MGKLITILPAVVLGLWATAPAAAETAAAGPRLLTSSEMDAVTAGAVQLGVTSGAIATGNIAAASAQGVSVSNRTTEFVPGSFSESGLAAGTAVAIGPGGTNATVVNTSASSSLPLVSVTGGGSAGSPFGQASFGFSYTSGGTFFLP